MFRKAYKEKIHVLFRSVCMKAGVVITEGMFSIPFNIFSYYIVNILYVTFKRVMSDNFCIATSCVWSDQSIKCCFAVIRHFFHYFICPRLNCLCISINFYSHISLVLRRSIPLHAISFF